MLDFASEKNRGDAVLQLALIRLTRKYFRDAELVICTVYGANQFPEALIHFEYSSKEKTIKEIVGGLMPTYYPISEKDVVCNEYIQLIKKAFSLLLSTLIILALIIKIPSYLVMKFLPYNFRHTFKHFMEADLVIWNGRNLHGPGFLMELYSIFTLLFHPIICMLLKKPIACVKTSVWQLKNPLARIIIKILFKKLIFISVREENSMENLKKILGESNIGNTIVLPDLSLYILRPLSKKVIKKHDNKNKKLKIGLTLMDWRWHGLEARRQYVCVIRNFLRYLIKEFNADVIVIPQVTKIEENVNSILCDILRNMNYNEINKIHILRKELSLKELLEIYANIDFLIATRMHSAIFALSVGTPTLAIAYDQGAKWGIFKMLGAENIVLNYKGINEQLIINKFKWIWSNRKILINTVQKHLDKLYMKAEENVKLIFKIFKYRVELHENIF